MRIISYEFKEPQTTGWKFEKVDLGRLNLIVGDSGSGKTRFLNTLFDLGMNVTDKRLHLSLGNWKTRLEQNGSVYKWEIRIDRKATVQKELLINESDPESPIIERDGTTFLFNGKPLPRLSRESTSIELLQDEDVIRPLHDGFSKLLRRDFSKDGLSKYIRYEEIAASRLGQKVQDLEQLFRMTFLGLNSKLQILKRSFPETYQRICSHYQELFPFVEEFLMMNVRTTGSQIYNDSMLLTTFSIKEKQVADWISIPELASGMQKALLILTDLYSLPEGAIYLIDEYENSLGVSVIDFLPECLNKLEKDIQVIITSHHPYVINQIPIKDWIVFHRDGSTVKARYGESNVDHYGKSKQRQFIQLINDPFYNRGLE